ncbi:FecCD family ABC transporter permease [Nocardioides xinjiangensis]|uniref:FecCD family ABC transporter permease n=1 Tax=Nocardioides xinjiangensis TaxID=2817376 RepID=UPI0027DDBB63|nr:iron ABC transporter permease [Nocardioides sp. SYSU D00514]
MSLTVHRPVTASPAPGGAADAAEARAVVRRARRAPRRHLLRLVGVLVVVLVGAFAARVLLGDYTVTIPDFVRILGGEQIPGATYIVMESKLPRAVLAVLAGLAFGIGGAIFQTTLRNPLASPDIVGVSLGASAAAVSAITLAGWSGWPVSAAAVVGALGVALAVRGVAGDHGGFRLVLAGIGLAAAMQSVIQYVFTRVDEWDVQLVLRWLTGSVNGVAWPSIGLLALSLAVLLPATAWAARSLPATELGDDTAAGLGVGRGRTDVLMLLGVLLVAVGVAAAGPIAFVAFLSGPIARALNRGRTTLLAAGLVGAVIVLVGDHVGAYAFADLNLPVGVVTGAFGAPFLLWLLARGHTGRRVA